MAQRFLLSIDGGGIRGIIPACALVALERTMGGKLTRDVFHFVGGTSTGAILTAGVAAGIPAEQILRLYVDRGPELFRGGPGSVWNTLKRVFTGSMYDIATLHRLLCEELGDRQDWTMNSPDIDLLITAKRVSDGMPYYFVKDNEFNKRTTGKVRLADCVVASAAAPTYFQPWPIASVGDLVDGGVGVAGNPVYVSCVEAFSYTGKYKPEETTVVSLGTGRFPTRMGRPPKAIWPPPLWTWLLWILGELLDSPGEQQTDIAFRQFVPAGMRFYRWDIALERHVDMADAASIDDLRQWGEREASRIPWQGILDGTTTELLVQPSETLFHEYARPTASTPR